MRLVIAVRFAYLASSSSSFSSLLSFIPVISLLLFLFPRVAPHCCSFSRTCQSCVPILSASSWQHICFTYDNTTTVSDWYGNGVFRCGGPQPPVFPVGTSSSIPLSIGSSSVSDMLFFSGTLDDIVLYNRSLTSDEIYSIFLESDPGPLPTPTPFPTPSSTPTATAAPTYSPSSSPNYTVSPFPASSSSSPTAAVIDPSSPQSSSIVLPVVIGCVCAAAVLLIAGFAYWKYRQCSAASSEQKSNKEAAGVRDGHFPAAQIRNRAIVFNNNERSAPGGQIFEFSSVEPGSWRERE